MTIDEIKEYREKERERNERDAKTLLWAALRARALTNDEIRDWQLAHSQNTANAGIGSQYKNGAGFSIIDAIFGTGVW